MKYTTFTSKDDRGKKSKAIVLNPLNSSFSGEKINDLICFSHLRWNFVFQRPQHLLVRWAREMRVFYFEEPVMERIEQNFLEINISKEYPNVYILTPHIQEELSEKNIQSQLYDYVNSFVRMHQVRDYILWYITPMSLPFTRHLNPKTVIYDCMDELSCFKGAHPQMINNEVMLMQFADTVFTGGHSLYNYKKDKHFNIYPFPSSIDKTHFESGSKTSEPEDQLDIPHPRVGFYGVIDERMDIDLLDGLAKKMPEFHFIIIGPVIKIDYDDLPKHKNIHYLGSKKYSELPSYLAYWDVAFLPFAKNESTRFISPTKTPEYLCAGKPVVSTSIHDVKDPYGDMELVQIADSVDDFSVAIQKAMLQINDQEWHKKTKDFLNTNSWDLTFSKMKKIIFETLAKKQALNGKTHRITSEKTVDENSSDIRIRIR